MGPLRDLLMDWLRPGWRERAEAQDPIWSLGERTVVASFGGITAWFGVRAALAFHFRLHPEDRLRFSDSSAQLPVVAFVGALLTLFLLFCLFGVALNSLEGMIPWARRRAETGSDRVPGLTVGAANRGLIKAAVALGAVAIPLDAYALLTSWSAH